MMWQRLNQSMLGFRSWMFVSVLLVPVSACRFSPTTQNGSGVALFEQGRYAEALQYFERAKQTDAANPDTYYNLASTYHKLGVANKNPEMIKSAEQIYNQCLDLAPSHVEAHRGLAVLLVESGQGDKAFTLLRNWAQNNPSLSDPRVELARLHQEFNQNKEAEQYLDQALAMDPNNAKAWAAKGKMRENAGQLMLAKNNYEQSLALNAKQPDLYQRLGALNVRIAQSTLSASPNSIQASNPTGTNSASTGVEKNNRY